MTPGAVWVADQDTSVRRQDLGDGRVRVIHDYFGKSSPRRFGPEAFRIEYPASRRAQAHFHTVDQFQLFSGAPGAWFGRRPLTGATIRYTDAYVTYGPFGTRDQPMRFFTLRAVAGSITAFMPGDRHRLLYRGRRQLHADLEPLLTADPPRAGTVDAARVIAPHDDGLAASCLRVGPRAVVVLRSWLPSGRNGGTFAVVLGGHATAEGFGLGPRSLAWVPPGPGTTADTVQAGATGVTLLLLTYPDPPTTEVAGRGAFSPS